MGHPTANAVADVGALLVASVLIASAALANRALAAPAITRVHMEPAREGAAFHSDAVLATRFVTQNGSMRLEPSRDRPMRGSVLRDLERASGFGLKSSVTLDLV
jgi:hypothetical protein